jgi:hypothetical protein
MLIPTAALKVTTPSGAALLSFVMGPSDRPQIINQGFPMDEQGKDCRQQHYRDHRRHNIELRSILAHEQARDAGASTLE